MFSVFFFSNSANMSIYKVILLLALSVLQCSARPEPTDINNSDQLLFSPRIARQDGQSPISLPTLYQEWRNQSTEMVAWQLMLMFVTAGDGDDFYNLEVSPRRLDKKMSCKYNKFCRRKFHVCAETSGTICTFVFKKSPKILPPHSLKAGRTYP